ncbi:hypothetical protein LC55x_2728 [Lysobacter capsici]|nr:hypothetical protein LC55x_2728 [Lysobacter capsici]
MWLLLRDVSLPLLFRRREGRCRIASNARGRSPMPASADPVRRLMPGIERNAAKLPPRSSINYAPSRAGRPPLVG